MILDINVADFSGIIHVDLNIVNNDGTSYLVSVPLNINELSNTFRAVVEPELEYQLRQLPLSKFFELLAK